MPNIAVRAGDVWPCDLDDLRAHPARLVYSRDLARLGIVRSYGSLKRLPPALRMPGRAKAWEARTVLTWIGADPQPPAAQPPAAQVPPNETVSRP